MTFIESARRWSLGLLLGPVSLGAAAHAGVLGLCVSGTGIAHLSAMVNPYIPEPKPPPEPEPSKRSLVILETVQDAERVEAKERPEPTEAEAIPPPPHYDAPSNAGHTASADDEALKAPSERLAENRLNTLPSFDKLIVLPEDASATMLSNALDVRSKRNSALLSVLGSDLREGALAALQGETIPLQMLAMAEAPSTLADTLGAGTDLGAFSTGGAGLNGVGTLIRSQGGGTIGTGGGLSGIGRTDPSDTSVLRRAYVTRIGRAVRRVRDYPPSAEDEGIEGTVVVKITIGASGEVRDVVVVRSSGHSVLDEAAVRSIRALGSLPAPPAELEWGEQAVQVSIVYSLDR